MHNKTVVLAALFALAGAPAFAQSTLHENDFEGRRPAWQTHGLWAVDGTPGNVAGGAAASGTKSLNFNNGTDYAGRSRGAAASPAIPAPAGETLALKFRCNYETETTGTQWDKRTVLIKLNGSVTMTLPLGSQRRIPRDQRCAAMGVWHWHEITVPTHTATHEVQVEFVFDSVDAYSNDHAGWFVDDFRLDWPGGPAAQAFNSVKNTSVDFRQYSVSIEVGNDKSVTILQSSPTARYAPITGTATDSEFRALADAVSRSNLASVPGNIPDPNVYIVAPTTFNLEVDAPVSSNHNTVGGSLGVYGQWDPQVRPVMDALLAIQTRLLSPQPPSRPFETVKRTTNDFRSYMAAIEVKADKSVTIMQSSPTALYMPVNGTATDAEFDALTNAIQNAALATIPGTIPDPATYIVPPTTFELAVTSQVSSNDNTVTGNVGAYGAWAAQMRPVMDALDAIQTRLLGSPPVFGDDHGDDLLSATQLQLDPAVLPTGGEIALPGDVDFFVVAEIVPMIAIFPPPESDYTFETTVNGNMDTVIELYTSDGTMVASNDDGGQGLASRLTYRAVRGTALYCKVRHYSSQGTGSYTIKATTAHVSNPPVQGDDHSDTTNGATLLNVNDAAVSGQLDGNGDVDMFNLMQIVPAIFPPPTYTYVIETTVSNGADTVIELLASDGVTVLASDDDGGQGYASKIVWTGQAGTAVFVRVRHYSSNGTGNYTVSAKTQ